MDISLALSAAAEALFGNREVLRNGKGGRYPSICVIRESATGISVHPYEKRHKNTYGDRGLPTSCRFK